ncbi:MAG: DUF1848 domain-containing protein [Planctomycetota bacterium]|jgi:hypothetical protein|nr:DUF1848 domain-containing protein [Planctomycetota bacterium]
MVAFRPDDICDKVSRSRKLEGIVFWTKDIRNLAFHPRLRVVAAQYPAIVQYTVTGLAGSAWEPNVPPLAAQMDALRELKSLFPEGAIRWRFDPVLPSSDTRERFRRVLGTLRKTLGVVDGATVSFPDPYKKAVDRAKAAGLAWPTIGMAEKIDLIEFMSGEFGVKGYADLPAPLRLCCEPELLRFPGVEQAHCVDNLLFNRLYDTAFGDLGKDPGQREACGCMKSTDIGSYDMACQHGCRYCYANPHIV